MIERFGELPDDVDQLKALALRDALAPIGSRRSSANKTDAEALRSETLRLKAEVKDLAQANAAAKAEIARLTSILKTLRRGRFGKRSEKLGADEDEQQSFVFEELETGLEAIERASPPRRARSRARPRRPSRAFPRIWSGSRRSSNPRSRRASRTRSGSGSARTRASGSTSCGRGSG